MTGRGAVLAALLLSPLPVLAQEGRFEGDWATGDPMACDLSGRDSMNFALRFRGNVLRGLESECRMSNAVTVPDINAVLQDVDCIGEGDSWQYRGLFMIDREDQLVLIANDIALVYPRCQGYAEPAAD
ncbi:hypothetical protein [Pararhodobacter sp.]|uniref:hypothetical protein n=1 Tax=Pararhodobacter sp. TaxID=2127056 RepID=UPI002FDC8E58